MEPWHVAGTRKAIGAVFGREQLALAAPPLRTLDDRQFYARFHYGRAKSTLGRYVRSHLHDKDFFPIAVGVDKPEWNRFNVVIRKLGADLIACVQSLHALPDALASAVYFSLALDRVARPQDGKYVNHRFVLDALSGNAAMTQVQVALRKATSGSQYKHLAALCNRSKHTSIVFPALNCDLTGDRPERYMLVFPSFTSNGKMWPEVYVSEFLPPAHEAISRSILETGKAVHAVLQRGA